MGFFSSVVKFIKDVVKSIVNAIAKIVNGVFGSPIVFALALLVVTILTVGAAAFVTMLSNPLLMLTAHPIVAAVVANFLTTVASLISPKFGQIVGYTVGLISFVVSGFSVYSMLTDSSYTGVQLLTNWLGATFTISMPLLEAVFTFIGAFSWLNFFTELAAGPDSPYITGLLDGFFVVPEVVGGAADDAVDAVVDSLFGGLSLLFWGALGVGAYLYFSDDTPETVVRLEQGVANGGANL